MVKNEYGASPIAVAQTRRIHFAKRLIDEGVISEQDYSEKLARGQA